MSRIEIPADELAERRKLGNVRVQWHGQECKHLGTWPATRLNERSYAAVKFPWNGRYDYEIVPPEWVK